MKLLALVTAALLFPQEKNEAEALLDKVADKVAKAKTFQCSSSIAIHHPQGHFTAEQSFLLAEGNKLRFEMKVAKPGGEEKKQLIVSDGSKLHVVLPETKTRDTPADLNLDVLTMIPRVCLMGAVEAAAIQVLGGVKAMEGLVFSDFKLEKSEKVGEREIRILVYKIKQTQPTRAVQSIDAVCKLWVDAASLLPVKRELTMKWGDKGDAIWTETFTDTKLDEKIDPAKFELPKEAK